MRISHVSIKNYRCLEHIELDVDDYTALIGVNGAGKSSVLYALDWFFNGRDLDEDDISRNVDDAASVQVEVTFSDLTPRDRETLGSYGKSDIVTFRKTWTPEAKSPKIVGNAWQGPGFGAVRTVAGADNKREAYKEVAHSLGLPWSPKITVKDIEANLLAWEADERNADKLDSVPDEDASHMFGINGTNVINECFRLVMIPAAADLAADLGRANKGTPVADLIGAVVSQATVHARQKWLDKHEEAVEELEGLINEGVTSSVADSASRINAALSGMLPGAEVTFEASTPDWQPKVEASIATKVTVKGDKADVSRQGHGVQRAVMMALLRALVPGRGEPDHTDGFSGADGPEVMVCVEEPEIYQHPIRVRSLARALGNLADTKQAQVLLATHSPYFVTPDRFESLRLIRLDGGRSTVTVASMDRVTELSGVQKDALKKLLTTKLPTSFSEGFFADGIILVEGDTDKVLLESVAERLGSPLEDIGLAVLAVGGKKSLRGPHAVFTSLGIPVFAIADGDFLGGERVAEKSVPKGEGVVKKSRESADQSNSDSTVKLMRWIDAAEPTLHRGDRPYEFGDPTIITDTFMVWWDDLETELKGWDSYCQALKSNGEKLRGKNALSVRAAAMDASIEDLPETLKALVSVVSGLPGRGVTLALPRQM